MSTQVQLRRDIAANVASFIGKPGEVIVDTTNNRLCLQDGATAGGWPVAKLAETQTFARRAVADANTSITAADVIVAATALTTTRIWTLPPAANYPPGRELTLQDESGQASAAMQIVVTASGGDLIAGAAALALSAPFRCLRLRSDGGTQWLLAAEPPGMLAKAPHGGAIAALCLDELVTLRGATTNATTLIPAGAILLAVSNRVVTPITGATSYSCGVANNLSQFGSSLGVAAGSANLGLIGPNPYYSDTPIIFTAAGGAFASGAVRLTLHLLTPAAARF